MRSAAWPSQNWGTLLEPERVRWLRMAARMPAWAVPAMTLVPLSTVTGRSVLSRTVTQGTPKQVVSS